MYVEFFFFDRSRPTRTEPPTNSQTVPLVLHPFHPHPATARGAATACCSSMVASITKSQHDSLDSPRSNTIELVALQRHATLCAHSQTKYILSAGAVQIPVWKDPPALPIPP
ncbi:hypothetical protein BD410DRAFT_154506 [Rickenella mellea]|uniref:Uncharacterized protein n=1 Tax=Rickenella mellea TaxID=50990 RepID=A0A4Y7PKI7_9AGAM|nr:hypothetical protein BD410DRAFT_154506 [Rickenella mellea]